MLAPGWLKGSRKQVTDNLFKIVKQLRKEHAVARGGSALQIIAGARIPIVKVHSSPSCQYPATKRSVDDI